MKTEQVDVAAVGGSAVSMEASSGAINGKQNEGDKAMKNEAVMGQVGSSELSRVVSAIGNSAVAQMKEAGMTTEMTNEAGEMNGSIEQLGKDKTDLRQKQGGGIGEEPRTAEKEATENGKAGASRSQGQEAYREKMLLLQVGSRFPGVVPPMGISLSIGTTLNIVARIEHPSKKEIRAFRHTKEYGLYQGADLPHGLLIWRFSDSFGCETPFNPRLEETVRHGDVQRFLRGEVNACQRILIDETGTVRAVCLLGLDGDLVTSLRQLWSDPDVDWSDYELRYEKLMNWKSSDDVWRSARKWKVQAHMTEQAHATADIATSTALRCPRCDKLQAQLNRGQDALRLATDTETSLRQQLQSMTLRIAETARTKADLEKKVASLSTDALQQEVAALNLRLDEKGFDNELLTEQLTRCNKTAAALQAQNSDLDRRKVYLESLLTKNGIPFNRVCGHGDARQQNGGANNGLAKCA